MSSSDTDDLIPFTWLERLNKTIAMITASESYQRYLKQRRIRMLRKSKYSVGIGRRDVLLAESEGHDCVSCSVLLPPNSKTGMCKPCLMNRITFLSSSGLTTDQVAKKLKLTKEHVRNLFNERSILMRANKIVNKSFRHNVRMVEVGQ